MDRYFLWKLLPPSQQWCEKSFTWLNQFSPALQYFNDDMAWVFIDLSPRLEKIENVMFLRTGQTEFSVSPPLVGYNSICNLPRCLCKKKKDWKKEAIGISLYLANVVSAYLRLKYARVKITAHPLTHKNRSAPRGETSSLWNRQRGPEHRAWRKPQSVWMRLCNE